VVGSSRTAGYCFVALYVALLLLLGIAPVIYAIYLALSNSGGPSASFVDAFNDYRFVPAFEHILEFMALWLVSQTFLVVALVLMLHNLAQRIGAVFRFLFYIPGALAGAASVVVWLFMLDPTASPFAFILHWLGYAQFDNTVAPGNLAAIFAIMAFFTGAGGWIVVMYGALNNIPHELIEAAQIDGSNAVSDRAENQAPTDPQVDRVHARALVRRRVAAVRRAPDAGRGDWAARCPPSGRRISSRTTCRVPVRQLQRSRRDLVDLLVIGLLVAASSSGAEGCLRSTDARASLRIRSSARPSCCSFTAFFFVPIIWLLLAPTKTDYQLLHESPFAFGSLSTFATHFPRSSPTGRQMLIWLKNSAIYSVGGTALALCWRRFRPATVSR
jgi:ABC-type glycerol-3-phosphate transport system permease component